MNDSDSGRLVDDPDGSKFCRRRRTHLIERLLIYCGVSVYLDIHLLNNIFTVHNLHNTTGTPLSRHWTGWNCSPTRSSYCHELLIHHPTTCFYNALLQHSPFTPLPSFQMQACATNTHNVTCSKNAASRKLGQNNFLTFRTFSSTRPAR